MLDAGLQLALQEDAKVAETGPNLRVRFQREQVIAFWSDGMALEPELRCAGEAAGRIRTDARPVQRRRD